MTANKPLSEQYHEVARRWVDSDAAASILEEAKSATLSQMMLAYPLFAVNKSEMTVKASPQWRDYLTKMVEARKNANYLKVQMEMLKMRHSEWQSEEANRRAEMKLS